MILRGFFFFFVSASLEGEELHNHNFSAPRPYLASPGGRLTLCTSIGSVALAVDFHCSRPSPLLQRLPPRAPFLTVTLRAPLRPSVCVPPSRILTVFVVVLDSFTQWLPPSRPDIYSPSPRRWWEISAPTSRPSTTPSWNTPRSVAPPRNVLHVDGV